MIEVLVTMVIVAVGLFGAAAMIVNGLDNNRDAYLRTQASNLAYDMADRIRTNASEVGEYTGFSTAGASTALPTCVGSDDGCGPADLAAADKAEWARLVQGSGEATPMLPEAQGSVAADGDDIVITIDWPGTQWDNDSGAVANQDQTFTMRFNL